MDSEAGVFAMAFDHSGTRLITAEADKTIKLYREDDTAVSILLNDLRKSLWFDFTLIHLISMFIAIILTYLFSIVVVLFITKNYTILYIN